MLAMTECRRGEQARISAAAVSNAVVDWVSPETFLDDDKPVTSTKKRSKKQDLKQHHQMQVPQAPPPLTPSLLLKLRTQAFDPSKPSTYFDPFASPIHFLRTPSLSCPPSTSPQASSDSADSTSDIDAQFAALLSLEFPSGPSPLTAPPPAERRRRTPLRWPPASALLIPPQLRVAAGKESALSAQAEEFAGLMRRALVKSDAAARGVRVGGRRRGAYKEGDYGEDDEEALDEDDGVLHQARERAERAVRFEVGSAGCGLWCWEDGREEVRRVGEWFRKGLSASE